MHKLSEVQIHYMFLSWFNIYLIGPNYIHRCLNCVAIHGLLLLLYALLYSAVWETKKQNLLKAAVVLAKHEQVSQKLYSSCL
jgi:hypothetical protein